MPQPYKLFTIYAREDEQYLTELLGQLRPLELAGRIKVWSDREINPGVEWEKTIVQKLDTADIILILVSAAYYSSVYIHEVEIKYAISRHEQGEARVLPIIVRPCSFLDDPVISQLQVLPTDGKPVTDRRHWHERDDAWLDVVAGVKRTLDLLRDAELEKEKSARDEALAAEQVAEQQRLAALTAKRAVERQKEAEKDLENQAAQTRREQEERKRLEQLRLEQELAARRAEQETWQKAVDAHTLDTYQSYLTQYPQGEHAREVRFQIKELKRAAAAPLPVRRYAAYGGGVLALALAIWLGWGREKDTLSFLMVPVTGGTFTIGSRTSEEGRYNDECQHNVIVESFSISKFEVTQVQWEAIMGNNPSSHKGCNNCPVETISWDDVQEFIQKLNSATGKRYRLATEVEWEYAARGGNNNWKRLYAGSDNLDRVAWYSENSGDETHIVGGKAPNALGLYDMSGNVCEWCQDTYQPYPCDASTKVEGAGRVNRGGSWGGDARSCRVASRYGNSPEDRFNNLGFRLASSPQ